jgi:hypothetical protein
MLPLITFLIIPLLAPESSADVESLGPPAGFFEFTAKTTWTERVQRGEYSVVGAIAIASLDALATPGPGTFYSSGEPTFVSFKNKDTSYEREELVAWAIARGLTTFCWQPFGASQKPAGDDWLNGLHRLTGFGEGDRLTKHAAAYAIREIDPRSEGRQVLDCLRSPSLRASGSLGLGRPAFSEIFDADRIYSETWAARWFPIASVERPLAPNEPPSHYRHLDFEPFSPRPIA